MKALDTNVLARLLLQDDAAQFKRAYKRNDDKRPDQIELLFDAQRPEVQ